MVTNAVTRFVSGAAIACVALSGCSSTRTHERPQPSAGAASGISSNADTRPHRIPVPCDGTKGLAGLLQDRPSGTIAVSARVAGGAVEVDKLAGVEVRARFALKDVTLVAGPRTDRLPGEVTDLMAETTVPVFLPPGDYVLLVYPDPDSGGWSVLMGAPGMFEVTRAGVVRERCMLDGLSMNPTQQEVIDAARNGPRGPIEPLSDVVSELRKQLG